MGFLEEMYWGYRFLLGIPKQRHLGKSHKKGDKEKGAESRIFFNSSFYQFCRKAICHSVVCEEINIEGDPKFVFISSIGISVSTLVAFASLLCGGSYCVVFKDNGN